MKCAIQLVSTCQFYGNEENNNCIKCDEEIYTKDREEIN